MGRREQILERAAGLFAARGFHGVSVHDVGAACGISGPALYRHFPSDARNRVRRLQRSYIDLWVEELQQIRPTIDRAAAQARVRAVFGLLNSTPRSGRLPDAQMRELLTSMASAALH